jgi:hypothetical protein
MPPFLFRITVMAYYGRITVTVHLIELVPPSIAPESH